VVVEELARRWGLRWGRDRYRARLAEGRAGGEPGAGGERPRVALLLPQTYMNDAGRSVGPARGAFRVPLERLLVVHDEIDLPFGELRARVGGGLAGHNGLRSLKRELGSGDFARLRIGVGRPDSTDPEIVSSWVLGRFREPREEVQGLVDDACRELDAIVLEGAEVRR
jgi:PTH1 family peptidyl-tRNA hydrolase